MTSPTASILGHAQDSPDEHLQLHPRGKLQLQHGAQHSILQTQTQQQLHSLDHRVVVVAEHDSVHDVQRDHEVEHFFGWEALYRVGLPAGGLAAGLG